MLKRQASVVASDTRPASERLFFRVFHRLAQPASTILAFIGHFLIVNTEDLAGGLHTSCRH